MSWYELYSPKNNQDLIERLLKYFKFNRYNFIFDGYNDYDILIENGLYTYKLELHDDEELLYLYKKATFRGGQKGSKEFHTPFKKIHSNVWYNAFKEISNID